MKTGVHFWLCVCSAFARPWNANFTFTTKSNNTKQSNIFSAPAKSWFCTNVMCFHLSLSPRAQVASVRSQKTSPLRFLLCSWFFFFEKRPCQHFPNQYRMPGLSLTQGNRHHLLLGDGQLLLVACISDPWGHGKCRYFYKKENRTVYYNWTMKTDQSGLSNILLLFIVLRVICPGFRFHFLPFLQSLHSNQYMADSRDAFVVFCNLYFCLAAGCFG